MSKNPLVIELGERSVQVCRPARVKEGKNLKLDPGLAYSFPMPDLVMDNGFITNPAELGKFIKENLKKHKIREKNVIFIMNSAKIVVREALLPPVSGDKKIKALVDANVGDYFPIDLSGFRLGYTVAGLTTQVAAPAAEGGPADVQQKLRVSVYAVPAEMLDGYNELAKTAELKIQSLDYAGNSEYQLFKEINAPGVTMYAYIDHVSSRMTFMRGDEVLLQRSLSFGGGTLPDEYMTQTGTNGKEAYHEAVEVLSRPQYLEPPMPEEKANVVFARLAIGIERSLRYFNSKYGGSEVNSVVLTGPLARLYRLREIVENELQIGVVVMTEQREASDHLTNVKKSLQYLDCIGASIAPVGFTQTKTQTKAVEKEKEKAGQGTHSLSGGILILALGIIGAAMISFSAWLDLEETKAEKKELEESIAGKLYAEDIYNDYVVYRTGANGSLDLLNTISSRNDDLRAFFEELEEKMPSEILLLSVSCAKQGVSMNVTVPTKTDVARVMVKLREFESLGRLQVPSISETSAEDAAGAVSFSAYFEYLGAAIDDPGAGGGTIDIEGDLNDYYENGGVTK
ncbi:hypothetical protein FACS1894208_03400 [Clostridia bacterium]|nr:hypothetical protein FACS1894208_03400 [Clostridia bacterium]